jgi:xylulokinase
MANVFDRPLWASADAPHACVGAGILAGVGVGLYPSIADAVQRLPDASRQIRPQSKQVALYRERREQYRRLYPLLKQEMHMLAGEG